MKKMEKIMEQKKSDDFSSCNCVNPCEEDQYHITSSSRQWPTKSYAVYLRESICAALSPSTCEHLRSLDMFTLGYNFIKINIYFEDLNYEYIKEKPEIEESAFASDIGGALGQWIGLSFISVFEIIQLMLEICRGIHCSTNTKDIIGKQ
ncbi:acid-sensing ion channel 4-B-like [Mytilus californianus]|uniref:acid-sensing ion channel 4-B-like n=1 Tax=Mytilus californianus TaxID=6549 RepID=UPI0022461D72|nr:acid-sensing ion channel 4-B-like [Mytilus californianus]